jgi:hypothetical protein
MKKKKSIDLFIKFIENESLKGSKLIRVQQQKRKNKNSFYIYPIYKNNKLASLAVECTKLPGDSILPIEIFNIVINELNNAENKTLKKGNAQQKGIKIGQPGLEDSTLEAIVAIRFYGNNENESVYRRIPIISNILVAAGICENIREGSMLKLLEH